MEEFNSFCWLRFSASTAVHPEGCEENLYLGDIWSQVGQWFQTKLVIQQRLSAHHSPHRVSKSQWRTVLHISRWWHFHGEMRVEWAASDQIRHRVEKPGYVAPSHGERMGGSRVCKNHLLGVWAMPAIYCGASVTQVAALGLLESLWEEVKGPADDRQLRRENPSSLSPSSPYFLEHQTP